MKIFTFISLFFAFQSFAQDTLEHKVSAEEREIFRRYVFFEDSTFKYEFQSLFVSGHSFGKYTRNDSTYSLKFEQIIDRVHKLTFTFNSSKNDSLLINVISNAGPLPIYVFNGTESFECIPGLKIPKPTHELLFQQSKNLWILDNSEIQNWKSIELTIEKSDYYYYNSFVSANFKKSDSGFVLSSFIVWNNARKNDIIIKDETYLLR
jgi:hypothetical protein